MKLELRAVRKRFGAVVAVDGVDLAVRGGQVLALLGENGAGKSTLAKLLYGVHSLDAGEIIIDGAPRALATPRAARAAGIGMVFQQFSLIPALTVAENLMLAWPRAPGWLTPRAPAWRAVAARLAEVAPEIDPRRRAGELSVGEKQLVELAKVLNLAPRLLLLDEPSSVLSRPEAERLWAQVRALAAAGTAIVLITHKLEDVSACADRVAVMRAGRLVGQTDAVNDRATIVTWMMGSEPAPPARRRPGAPGAMVLSARDVVAGEGPTRIEVPALDVAAGEVLGIAGVTGNGQETLGRVLAGITPAVRGHVRVAGQDPGGAARVAFIPEQPAVNGCAPELSLLENLEILEAKRLRFIPRWGEARERGMRLLERFDVRPRALALPVAALSGGNLQKLIAARELTRDPQVVVACYPTMGLDLGAAAMVVGHLLEAASRGAAVVWISEELDPLLAHADRVAVMHGGRLRGPIPTAQATRQGLGAWMAGLAA